MSTNPIKLDFNIPESTASWLDKVLKSLFVWMDWRRTGLAQLRSLPKNLRLTSDTDLRLKSLPPNPSGKFYLEPLPTSVDLREFGRTILVPTQAIVPEMNTQNVRLPQ